MKWPERSRVLLPYAKRVAVRQSKLVEKCVGNMYKVMKDLGSRAEVKYISRL